MHKTNRQVLRVMFLTALPVEYQAVRAHLHALHEVGYKGTIYEQGTFSTLTGTCEVSITQVYPGNSSAAAEAERAMTCFSPDIMFFVGVAGGIKDVQLGDVAVATDVYNYEAGKADATFLLRPRMGKSTYDLVQRAQVEARKPDWLQLLNGPIPRQAPRVFIKPIAAGEKVITSTRSVIWQHIRTNYEDAVAVEMEGYGLLQAVYANQQVSALIIRGISDLIDNKYEADSANFQEIAARHASAFAFQILISLIGQQGEQTFPASPEEDPWDMPPFTSFARQNGDKNVHTHGTFSGIVIQENSGIQHIHNTVTLPSKEGHVEGGAYLQRGRAALLQGDYTTAKQHLTEAARLLDEQQSPAAGAQARFLQTLALLHGKRPRSAAFQTFQRIEELLESAIALLPAHSYLYAFALIKRDYAWNGFALLRNKANELIYQARSTSLSSQDRENIDLLRHCQPRLMLDAQGWWR